MMEAELDEHLGYEEYERSDNPDYRSGTKTKRLRSAYGEIPIDAPLVKKIAAYIILGINNEGRKVVLCIR